MLLNSIRVLASAATSWHVSSQQQSRRNALVASTALTQRRRELQEVEEFLAEHAARVARAQTTRLPIAPPAPTVRRSRTA